MEKKSKASASVLTIIAILLIATLAIIGHIETEQVNDRYNELLEEYGNLSVKYNQTSNRLNEINEWLLENKISRYGTFGENICYGKFIIENKSKVIISGDISYNEESGTYIFIEAEMGFDPNKNNEIFIKVSTWDTVSGTETEQWYFSGKDCLNMT
jgi:lipopolysaccharide export LptBFGC system permease protein LptF